MGKAQNPDGVEEKRIQILGPLLYGGVDRAKRVMLMREISEQEGISERTLRRWLFSYEHGGYQGLLPKSNPYGGKTSSVTEEIVDQAVMLRREVPTRSIRQIITILEMEGLVAPGEVKRSTLQDHLVKRGYGSKQLSMYHSTGAGAARRFQRLHRNDLWQMDLKYLIVLPETAKRKAQQLYASVIIDDATRLVTACRVYEKQDTWNVLDSFRHAIERYGLPDRVFTDNGSQYISRHMTQVCAKLGIKKLTARPRAASAKGKVEVFNKYLDSFVEEVRLKRPQSAAEVEHHLDIWLYELYQTKPHSALNGKTPEQAFKEDDRPLRWAGKEQLDFAFVFTEKRLVDKTGCLSFGSIPWEAGQDLIGMNVDVAFRPDNPDELEVLHQGFEPRKIRPLVITEHSAPRKRIPLPQKVSPHTSRELDAAKKQYEKHRVLSETAISYRSVIGAKTVIEEFYEFKNSPFTRQMTEDALFLTEEYEETLARLQYAARRQWFALLTGDCGTGKSTLIRRLSYSLGTKDYKVLYLADSKLTPRHFYNGLLDQLGVQGRFYRGDSKRLLHREVELMRGVHGLNPVVIVDEAHLLDKEMFEEIRFLLNFKMDSESPLTLILVGQTEIWKKLRKQVYTAVVQRLDLRCHLAYLDEAGTKSYILHHLRYAGSASDTFSDDAMQEIFRYSSGSPRLINKTCIHCLMYGEQRQKKIIDDHIVRYVVEKELP